MTCLNAGTKRDGSAQVRAGFTESTVQFNRAVGRKLEARQPLNLRVPHHHDRARCGRLG